MKGKSCWKLMGTRITLFFFLSLLAAWFVSLLKFRKDHSGSSFKGDTGERVKK